MDRIQGVPVQKAGQTLGREVGRLHEQGAVALGQRLELQPGAPGHLHLSAQAQEARRHDRLHAPEVEGVADAQIKRFQIQPALSTTRRHRIVLALQAMPKARGRGEIVRLANACTTPEEEDFLIGALAILAERQTTGAADYIALKVLGRLPGATSASGELHVPAPVDHVTWTEGVAGFARRDDLGAAPKVLLHTGTLSPTASAGLTAAGWKTVAVPYPAR